MQPLWSNWSRLVELVQTGSNQSLRTCPGSKREAPANETQRARETPSARKQDQESPENSKLILNPREGRRVMASLASFSSPAPNSVAPGIAPIRMPTFLQLFQEDPYIDQEQRYDLYIKLDPVHRFLVLREKQAYKLKITPNQAISELLKDNPDPSIDQQLRTNYNFCIQCRFLVQSPWSH